MEEYRLPKKAGFDAKYSKGKVLISTYYYIDRKISRYKYRYIEKNRELNPFTNVTFCYGNDQNEITVPAIVLVKSRGDVVLYDDFYKSNIDWKSLSEDKKRELYTEFVLHYLPKELGDAAVGNPITFIIMIIVGAVIAKAGAVIAACAALIGASFSVLNIIEGCKLISKSAEGYDSIYDVNATKVSAKDLARGIALLGIEVIPVLFGLIKRGIAKYNNKEIKIDEFVKREFGKNSKIRPKTNKSKTIKIENAAQMSVPQSEKTALREMTDSSQAYKHINPEQTAEISKETAKKYDQKIKWGINTINVRKEGKGFWGERMSQHNTRVDKYELKINPNNESFYLPHPMGGFVQFENLKNKTVQDGKLILTKKSFYHVADLPDFAKEKVLQEARRQIEAASSANYKIEWLISDKKAVNQLTELFILNNVNIKVSFLPE